MESPSYGNTRSGQAMQQNFVRKIPNLLQGMVIGYSSLPIFLVQWICLLLRISSDKLHASFVS